MKLQFLVFFSVFLAVFGLANYYVGFRGWQFIGSQLSFLNSRVYWISFFALIAYGTFGVMAKRYMPGTFGNISAIIGSYWLVALVYFLLILCAIDIFRLVNNWTGILPKNLTVNPGFGLTVGLTVLGSVLMIVAIGAWNARDIKVTSYKLTVDKRAGNIKDLHIALISDLHLGSIEDDRQKSILKVVNSLNPDLVLIAGDIIEDISTVSKNGILHDFKEIKSKYGTYACLGNHDYFHGNPDNIASLLSSAGIKVLRDSGAKVAESFYIFGREDKTVESMTQKKRMELPVLMSNVNKQLPVILMDHQPIGLSEAKSAGVDLQVSGHTHKGQFFPFNLITRKVYRLDYGLLKLGNLQLIVSSGAGSWGPPVRLGSISEVVDIRLKFL